MQTVTEIEIDSILDKQSNLLGSDLTQAVYDEKALQLHFTSDSFYTWFTFSMKPGNPYFFFSSKRIFLVKNKKKPLNLFLKTHFVDRSLTKISRVESLGRLIRFDFSGEGEPYLLLSLVPGRVNIEAYLDKKVVSAFKPKELSQDRGGTGLTEYREVREESYFEGLWASKVQKLKKESTVDTDKELKKKESGLKKMLDKLAQIKEDPWPLAGMWLKESQTLENAPQEFVDFLDNDKSLSWNIEKCFKQAKKNQLKVEGTQARVVELKKEIASLAKGERKTLKKVERPSLLAEAKIKGKTQKLPCGRIFIGKSGVDNLKLLRQAKPWYLWLHIKDYPGAYGIIERQKKQGDLDQKSLQEAATAVVRQSLPEGQSGVFEVIYAECRYVRPIKGAKSGQVTYSHEKVLPIKVET